MAYRAVVEDERGDSIGEWLFDSLPRAGEDVLLAEERYEILLVEHWPSMAEEVPQDRPQTRLYVRLADRVNGRFFPPSKLAKITG